MNYPPRESNCPDLTTEDNRTPIVEGMMVYNYYDGEWGRVEFIKTIPECEHLIGTKADGWFRVNGKLLNGVRVSTVDPATGQTAADLGGT